MTFQKNDFIEIDFTAKTKDGNIFDSTIKENIDNAELKIQAKPFVFSLGQGMFLEGVEDFLIGKDENQKEHKIELSAENAFGKRDPKLIQTMPLKLFREHKINPIPGFSLNFDGRIGKILSATGGRVKIDFNNPIAGKDVIYEVNVLRKIEDLNEKISSFTEFLFKRKIDFEIKDKKLILEVEKPLIQFAQMFADKYKEIFDLDLEVKEKEIEKTDKN